MIGYLGVFAIFYGGFHAFFATQLKVLIAYSTISQVGDLLMLFAFHSNTLAMHASLFMVFSHMFAKAGLFLIAGVLIASSQSKRISELKGIGYIKPLAVFTIALSAISLIGFPPTLGFSGKWYYLQAALQNQQWFLLIAILLSTFITAAYFFKLIILTLQPISKNKHFMTLPHAFSLQLIAFILSLCSLIFGLFSSSILAMLQGV
jgi:formate hydrogenlyase subunit 3/multisubunit Na+/H+ antiporter MnhD subunit